MFYSGTWVVAVFWGGDQFCSPALTTAGAERRPEQYRCGESIVLTCLAATESSQTGCARNQGGVAALCQRAVWGSGGGRLCAAPSPPPASLTPLGSHCLEASLPPGG